MTERPVPIYNNGKDFEQSVQRLLRATQDRVTSETLIGHKKVDLVLEESRFGKTVRTAVECKDWLKPLNKAQVLEIWLDYEPLISRGGLDALLVVSRAGFSASTIAYANSIPSLYLQTFEELSHSVLSFDSYINHLLDQYENSPDGLAFYWTPPRTEDRRDLIEEIKTWTGGSPGSLSSRRPLAILGAYGVGKSSLAKRLGFDFGKAWLTGGTARIPIVIRLGDLSSEQSLEGLLGRHLAGDSEVPGYSFQKFMRLNRDGHFLIVLDGFDEMKQLLNWTQFRFNLAMLNRLCEGDSRVILLGRPTAFETDAQYEEALHGKRTLRGAAYTEPGWPDYQEVRIASFTSEQIEHFLVGYASVPGRSTFSGSLVLEALRTRHIRDLARRPVQLRMLADILPQFEGRLEELDQKSLYDAFIDLLIDKVIEREGQKEARLAFDTKERRAFLTAIAFFLWSVRDGASMIEEQVLPDGLFEPYAHGRDLASVRADLLTGSPLDRRPGERLSFPHRSFQEFLVAEELWRQMNNEDLSAFAADQWVTDEVASFMRMMASEKDRVNARSRLAQHGHLHERTLRVLFPDLTFVPKVLTKEQLAGPVDRWACIACADIAFSSSSMPENWRNLLQLRATSNTVDDLLIQLFLASIDVPGHNPQVAGEILMKLLTHGSGDTVGYARIESGEVRALDPGSPHVGTFGRKQELAFGRIMGKGRISVSSGRASISGAERLTVSWFDPASIELLTRVRIEERLKLPSQAGGSRGRDRKAPRSAVNVRLIGMRKFLGLNLLQTGFVSDWLTDEGFLNGRLKLVDHYTVQESEELENVRESRASLLAYLQDRASVGKYYSFMDPDDLFLT